MKHLVILVCVIFLRTQCLCEENFIHVDHRKVDLQKEEHRELFEKFITDYNKNYQDEAEKAHRFLVFRLNLKKIEFLNMKERGSAKYGVTQFADLSSEEFSKRHGLQNHLADQQEISERRITVADDVQLPKSFDWREKGAVAEVKDQGFCGSCWAFSVTGNIEGQVALKNKTLISLSEQELVDCDTRDNGCGGGFMTLAYKSVIEKGLETEKDYPYEGYLSDGCAYNKSKARVHIDSYVVLPSNETQIAQWLVKNGPISIGINAAAMQFYHSGVSHPWKWFCKPSKIDHGVLIVGFGEEVKHGKTLPYWIVKNSWGHSWGRGGYYMVYRGDGTCGVNSMATSAIIGHSH